MKQLDKDHIILEPDELGCCMLAEGVTEEEMLETIEKFPKGIVVPLTKLEFITRYAKELLENDDLLSDMKKKLSK